MMKSPAFCACRRVVPSYDRTMLASRLVVSVVLVAGCRGSADRQPSVDLGSRPHLLGKLAGVDIRGTRAQLAKSFPELERSADPRKNDVEDGPLTYRVWFDSEDPTRIESFITFVARPLDDVVAAWGPGTPGREARDHYYVDEVAGIRFTASPPPEKGDTANSVIRAEPMIQLAKVLGAPGDLRLFGTDLLSTPWDEAPKTFTANGLIPSKLPKPHLLSSRDFVTELAPCELTVTNGEGSTQIIGFELNCRPDVAGGNDALVAAVEKKWGKPTRKEVHDPWIYPEARSPAGDAVRISRHDSVGVDVHVDVMREDRSGPR